jgi:hypothetical protein
VHFQRIFLDTSAKNQEKFAENALSGLNHALITTYGTPFFVSML